MQPECTLPVLIGPRVVLRPIDRADAPGLLRMLAEPGVARWWQAYDEAKLERDFYDPAVGTTYVVTVAGALAGLVQFHEETDPDYESAGVDITLGDRYQDQGLGTETLRVLLAYLIDERDHHRITIDPAAANRRAIHVYAKVGFKPVGIMRQYERGPDGHWHDGLLMDLLPAEFVRE